MIDKLYHNINEVAARFQVPASTIRYWCKMFGINPRRNNRNQRIFVADDINKLGHVKFLREEICLSDKGITKKITQEGWPRTHY